MKKIFNNKKIIYVVLFLIIILVGGSSFYIGYYMASESIKKSKTESVNAKNALKELQKLVDDNLKKREEKKKEKLDKNDSLNNDVTSSEGLDYQENIVPSKKEIKKPIIYTNKPKLVIIMDDMSFSSQVKHLKSLNIKITPSFFPPTKVHPFTPEYAKQFKHFMIHFPMEATSRTFKEEANTLHTNSSIGFIEARVKFIKKEFPNIEFVNNHTGSKFTANYSSMDRLYKVLNKYNLIFVDSRTISTSKASLLAKKYNKILMSRDVFLDNKPDINYIQNQLKQAIKIAKRRGYAIAICHPHPKTFEALKDSKNILKNIEVIYIDELYKLYKTHHLSKL